MSWDPWRWKSLLTCQLAGCALLASWLLPDTRALWDQLDAMVFASLNASLLWGSTWRKLWAVANHRLFDVLAAVLYVCLFLRLLTRSPAQRAPETLVTGVLLVGYAFAILELSRNVLFTFPRPSPTLSVEGAIRLSVLVPGFEFKDHSGSSFPGDHAISVLVFSTFIWKLGGVKYGLAAGVLGVLCTLPRLFSGAHWATDVLVGSVFVALVCLSVLLATPLHGWLNHRLSRALRLVWQHRIHLGVRARSTQSQAR